MNYPKYYLVEDVPVKLSLEKDQVFGENYLGNPYPIGKAIIDGVEIDYEEFKRRSKALAASS